MKTENKLIADARVVSVRGKLVTVYIPGKRDVFLRLLTTNDTVMPEKIERGMRVSVEGYIRGYYGRDRDGSMSKRQYFVADKIEEQTTSMERNLGIKGTYYDTPSCKYLIAGNVATKKDDGDWVRFTIVTDMDHEKRRLSSVHISMRSNEVAAQVKKGDGVCMVCAVSSPKKEVNGQMKYFEDIIGVDIARVDPVVTESADADVEE